MRIIPRHIFQARIPGIRKEDCDMMPKNLEIISKNLQHTREGTGTWPDYLVNRDD
jgi:hypothetical protein